MEPFKAGKDPRRGRGPKKGSARAGRPPDKFKEAMRGIASRADVITRLRRLTGKANKDDALFLKAWKEVADRGYGRGMQTEIHLPLDPKQLSSEQLERIANGEDPLLVLATTRHDESAAE